MVKGCGISFQGNESNLRLIVVTDTILCECTKNYCIVYFKWINYMECELHLKPKKIIILEFYMIFHLHSLTNLERQPVKYIYYNIQHQIKYTSKEVK